MERHDQASAAVSEAAGRTKAYLANELAVGKPPQGAAEAQRRWLTVLDRHEAGNRRRCVDGLSEILGPVLKTSRVY